MGPLTKEIPTVDFRSIRDALRLRWLIMPLCMIIGAGLMYSQKSTAPAAPKSTTLSKTYGGRDETSGLTVFGIVPDSIQEFPSFQNQLSQVQPATTVRVDVKLSDPRVSMVATANGEGRQYFTLTSSGVPNYEFVCTASERQPCDEAIEIYVHEVEMVRANSMKDGLSRLAMQIESVIGTTSIEQPTLAMQLVAINSAIKSTTGQLQFVRESVETTGGPADTFSISSLLFGLVAGLIISILIILQLTMTDDRIRNVNNLRKIGESLIYLGEVRVETKSTDATHVSASIIKSAKNLAASKIAFMPIGLNVASAQTLNSLNEVGLATYLSSSLQENIESSSVQELIANNAPIILIAQRNSSTMSQLVRTQETLARTGNQVLGVVLTSLNH